MLILLKIKQTSSESEAVNPKQGQSLIFPPTNTQYFFFFFFFIIVLWTSKNVILVIPLLLILQNHLRAEPKEMGLGVAGRSQVRAKKELSFLGDL